MSASNGTADARAGLSAADQVAYNAFTAIADHVERSRAITAWGRRRGNLPKPIAELRTESLRAARGTRDDDGRKVVWLALKVGLSASRVSRLTAPKLTPEGAAA